MKKYVFFIPVSILVCACSMKPTLKDLESKYINLVVENDINRFDSFTWKNSRSAKRGDMLYDLFFSNTLIGKTKKDIVAMLGKNTASFMPENQPCYLITYEGKKYYLGFTMNGPKAKNTVLSAGLYKDKSELSASREWFLRKMDFVKKYTVKYKNAIMKNAIIYKDKMLKSAIKYKNKITALPAF